MTRQRLSSLILGFLLLLVLWLPAALAWADPLEPGSLAPEFTLPATSGRTVSLSDFKGKKNLIVVFYPKDNTPGCTIQLCGLRDNALVFDKLNTAYVGVNPASVKSHEQFAKDQNYTFPLLSDADLTLTKAFGVKRSFGFNQRTVFIVDKAGVIRYVKEGSPSPETLANVIKGFNQTK